MPLYFLRLYCFYLFERVNWRQYPTRQIIAIASWSSTANAWSQWFAALMERNNEKLKNERARPKSCPMCGQESINRLDIVLANNNSGDYWYWRGRQQFLNKHTIVCANMASQNQNGWSWPAFQIYYMVLWYVTSLSSSLNMEPWTIIIILMDLNSRSICR